MFVNISRFVDNGLLTLSIGKGLLGILVLVYVPGNPIDRHGGPIRIFEHGLFGFAGCHAISVLKELLPGLFVFHEDASVAGMGGIGALEAGRGRHRRDNCWMILLLVGIIVRFICSITHTTNMSVDESRRVNPCSPGAPSFEWPMSMRVVASFGKPKGHVMAVGGPLRGFLGQHP